MKALQGKTICDIFISTETFHNCASFFCYIQNEREQIEANYQIEISVASAMPTLNFLASSWKIYWTPKYDCLRNTLMRYTIYTFEHIWTLMSSVDQNTNIPPTLLRFYIRFGRNEQHADENVFLFKDVFSVNTFSILCCCCQNGHWFLIIVDA